VFVVYCLGSGFCDGPITRSEELHWLCVCVCVSNLCDLETLKKNKATWARVEFLVRDKIVPSSQMMMDDHD
jgi:hypothetical protein